MKNWTRLIVAIAAAVWLSGCVVAIGNDGDLDNHGSWSERERDNRAAIAQLEVGMVFDDVVQWMPNEANFTESFTVDGADHHVLFYRTHRVEADGAITRDETTPLVFVDNVLVGWGEQAWMDATGRPLR